MIAALAQAVPEGRVFALDSQTLIGTGIQVLNGIILTAALGFILYKPVKAFMKKRADSIQNRIEESEKTMAKAKELIAEYESKTKNIDKEFDRVLAEARIKAADERKQIIDEANEESDRIKKRAESVIDAEKERIKIETRPYIIELATQIAQSYVALSLEKEEQEKLFDDALAELEQSQWQR